MKKHPERKSNRLKEYDYKQPGYYFVTICIYDRKCIFADIMGNQMQLNNAGQMVDQILPGLAEYYPDIIIDNYIVMPNHVHAIIEIKERRSPDAKQNNGQTQRSVPTTTNLSLSNVIQRFKMITTKKYVDGVKNNNWQPFNKSLWQRSFHDHIIRTDTSLQNIREYIINNPSTWDKDEYNLAHNAIKTG